MKKTLISHFYNEEYLLPWWLNHHKKMFDHAILIDYDSTDNSVNIIKEICPNWEIRISRFKYFEALELNKEVEEIENEIDGWKICLNTPEFLLGNFDFLENYIDSDKSWKGLGKSILPIEQVTTGHGIPVIPMVDMHPNDVAHHHIPLIEQKTCGLHYRESDNIHIRRGRLIHNKSGYVYGTGRHYDYTTEEMVILWYGWSPFNESMLNRKMQIKNKMPISEFHKGFGREHLWTKDEMINLYSNTYLPKARDLREELAPYIEKMNFMR